MTLFQCISCHKIENSDDLLTDQKVDGLKTFCSECWLLYVAE